MKIKRKFWFFFWCIIYAASAIVFYFILQKPPIGSLVIGFILLFTGRIQVGLMTRYINFCNRERTGHEEWVLHVMGGIESKAMHL